MNAETHHDAKPGLEFHRGMTTETVSLHGSWTLRSIALSLRDIQSKLANDAELLWDLRTIDSLDWLGCGKRTDDRHVETEYPSTGGTAKRRYRDD